MDFASPLLELVKELWGLASKHLGYICNLKDNVDSLRNAIKDLKAVSDDLKARVEHEEEEARAQRTKQVANWLGNVQEFVDGVDQVLREAEERDQIKFLSRCLSPNCWSSYKLGKRVNQMLNEAGELQAKKGEFDIGTLPLPPPRVLEMPMDETVGLDSSLNKVWEWLMDKKQVGVIGLYGTGGVGKTTLMKRINEKLLHADHEFDIVIWVVVSRQVNEDSIRDTIRKRLDIKNGSWEWRSRDQRVQFLREVLTRKKFVLLIDDIWERLDLIEIGVPRPSLKNRSKIVFTTRLKQVCYQMRANETCEVRCLTPEGALQLFENNVDKSIIHSHPEISELAKDIVRECKGLPLALITVGRAMAGRENPHEWKYALTTLKNNPYRLSGMVDDVYHILEFSYISLNDCNLQLCFLYCCLFPEDYPIREDNLIELWIGEGFLGDTNDLYSLRHKGEYVLGTLKMACLLESAQQCVKMHDVIRDMATWIARDHGQSENKLLALEKEEDMSAEMISKWGEAEKVSLWGRYIWNINRTPPECSQLKTLFIRETRVRVMPRGFFDSMTACLTILDLSDNKEIQLFPEDICKLINLQYLNVSATGVRELPTEIKNLTRLRWLLLNDTFVPFRIPTEAITNLPLSVFSQWSSSPRQSGQVYEEEIVEELGRMQHLTDLSIEVFKYRSVLNIFQSPNIRRSIRIAGITDCQDLNCIPISTDIGSFLHLEVLYLLHCAMLREIEITQGIGGAPSYPFFPSLVEVCVIGCGLSELSWLVHAPNLKNLAVKRCSSMEKIIGNGFVQEEFGAPGLFSHLKSLEIDRLPKLTSICDHTLRFSQGLIFRISRCPCLIKLPLDSNSVEGSFSVIADPDWSAKLEWDPAARAALISYGAGRFEFRRDDI